MDLSRRLRDVPDFPKPGILFKDITPLLADPEAMLAVESRLAGAFRDAGPTRVVGIESRGFLFGVLVARALGVGFAPVRKQGKLPWRTVAETYALEYGTDTVEMHEDAVGPGDRALIIDDLLATGGTAAAAARLVERLGAEVVGLGFVVELGFLDGRAKLGDRRVVSLVRVD